MKGYSREELKQRQKESQTRIRERLSLEHRCYECQGQDDRTLSGLKYCGRCWNVMRTKRQERRLRYRQEHRCSQCGNIDDRTLNGYSRCAVCAEKERKRKGESLDTDVRGTQAEES